MAITFDDSHVTNSGKKIPLEAKTHEPHSCEENPYNNGIKQLTETEMVTITVTMVIQSQKYQDQQHLL
ncbi:MAG TPA: hypothetical protein VE223_03920 [Nitrososphaeraceae archaeon]|nr:hypothetical protein [Nitrososphaeraceae archaeon]